MVNSQKITKNVYKSIVGWKGFWPTIIFLIVLFFRLFFAFQTPEFSEDSAYFVLYQIESISQTGVPYLNIGSSGDISLFPPVFYYVLAFFNLFMSPFIVGKVIPNIFASLTVFIVYALSIKFTRNHTASLFASTLSGFIPIFFLRTFNSISIYSLVVPLVLFSFYSFLMISTDESFVIVYLVSILLLSFTHPSVFFVVLGQIIYFTFVKIEGLQYKNVEIEVIFVSVFLVIWSQFLIFKNAFLLYGPAIIWQNTPSQIVSEMFRSISIVEAFSLMGIVPALAGVYVFYQYVKDKKSKFIFFFLSYSIPIFVMLWLRLIMPTIGLILLSSALVVVLGKYYIAFTSYIDKTKFSNLKIFILLLVALLIYSTSILPTFALVSDEISNAPDYSKVQILKWMRYNLNPSSVVLSSYQDGFLIKYHARIRTVMDSNFLLVDNVDKVVDDIRTFYTTSSLIDALRIAEYYDIEYVFLSDKTIAKYGVSDLFENQDCFNNIFSGRGHDSLYEITCSLVYEGE